MSAELYCKVSPTNPRSIEPAFWISISSQAAIPIYTNDNKSTTFSITPVFPAVNVASFKGNDVVTFGNVVRIMSADPDFARARGYGSFAGQFEIDERFFEPLPDEELGI